MADDESLIDQLSSARSATGFWKHIDHLLASAPPVQLVNLVASIRDRYPDLGQHVIARSVLNRILTGLALTKHLDHAQAALDGWRCLAGHDAINYFSDRRLISVIAYRQPTEHIEHLLESIEELEWRAQLLQAAVLRGKLDPDTTVARRLAVTLLAEDHPLGWLPLERQACEVGLARRSYTLASEAHPGIVPELPHQAPLPELASLPPSVMVKPVHDPVWGDLCTEAVRGWRDASNGTIDAGIWRLDGPPTSSFLSLLPALDLPYLQPPAQLFFQDRAPLANVLPLLYSAAAFGGAYSNGDYEAYGRLRAWRSIAGLVGVSRWPEDDSFRDIVRRASDAWWFVFISDHEWFHRELSLDIGIACHVPKQQLLTVLAATDTD